MNEASSAVDVAVVGAGVAGLLVARELVAGGREVTVLERGGFKAHAEQVRDQAQATDVATARPNHEDHPDTPGGQWDYVYGVGGSGLHWGGVAPRFLPGDFALHSRHGVGRDWPLTYDDLRPFYVLAERALAVAGGHVAVAGLSYRPPLAPHPPSPTDRLVGPHLQPYFSLPQARPTRSVGGRPACCGSGECGLCPVDSRYSPLHTLDDGLRAKPGFALRDRTIVVRVRPVGKAWGLDLVQASGSRSKLVARTVVFAANGIENAALLLRSQLGGDDVGRWLSDHQHVQYQFELSRPGGGGHGASISTGVSYAWADGDWRSSRGSQLVAPDNRGVNVGKTLAHAIAAGKRGREVRKTLTARFDRTIVLDTIGEDLPQSGRRVELSPERDRFGIPLNRLRYPPDSSYLERARAVLRQDLERRLKPLGARLVSSYRYRGGHQLGTCRMGHDDGVVNPDCRLHGHDGLYVVGGSAFPSYSAAHPTLTIAALAIRLGRDLAER